MNANGMFKSRAVPKLAANLRYNAHLLALADQTKTQELAGESAGCPANQSGTSDDHGWSSVTGAMDGGRGPCPVAGSVPPCTLPRGMKALLSQV